MAGKMVEKKIRSALPLYIAAGAFLVCAAVLPVYSLPGFLGACAVAAGAYFLSDKKIPPRVVMVPAPEDPFATGEEALDAAGHLVEALSLKRKEISGETPAEGGTL